MAIKNIYVSNDNILIVDTLNKLFIIGSNNNCKTGIVNNNQPINQPLYLDFDLEPGENIVSFYSMQNYILFYTSNKKLYISNSINSLETLNEYNNDKFINVNDACLQKFNTCLNNYEFLTSRQQIYRPRLKVDKANQQCCYLLECEVENIIVFDNFILFKKNNAINVFTVNVDLCENLIKKNIGLHAQLIETTHCFYWKLIFPFAIDCLEFNRNFIYFKTNDYNHIVSVDNNQINILWIYFASKLTIICSSIDYIIEEMTFYYNDNNDIYKFIHSTHSLEYLCGSKYKTKMLETTNTGLLTILDDSGLYIDNDYIHKCVNYNSLLHDICDLYTTENGSFILINNTYSDLTTVVGVDLYFNVAKCRYYKLYESCKTIVYIIDNDIFYCTSNKILGNTHINNITTNGLEYFIYNIMTINIIITNVLFSENIIVIISENKEFYYYLFTDFEINSFTKILFEDTTNTECNYNYLSTSYTSESLFNIHLSSNKFNKYLNIIECLPDYETEIKIQYINDCVVSYGKGTTRDFFNKALTEFQEKYLICHEYLSEFNLTAFKTLNSYQLEYIGILLAYTIYYLSSCLSIRLPISFLSALKQVELQLEDLEYFAMKEKPDVYVHLFKYKNDHQLFQDLNTDYTSYNNALCNITRYCHDSAKTNKKIQKISNKIAYGFTKLIDCRYKSFKQLDTFLSGNNIFDIKTFISKLEVCVYLNDTDYDTNKLVYSNIFNTVISKMTTPQLSNLLYNWSGNPSLCSTTYTLNIVENQLYDVNFVTCANQLNVNIIMFYEENLQLLVNYITERISTIIDC